MRLRSSALEHRVSTTSLAALVFPLLCGFGTTAVDETQLTFGADIGAAAVREANRSGNTTSGVF